MLPIQLLDRHFMLPSHRTYRTLPPQNWQSSPCHASVHKHVPFVQMPPFIHELSLMHFPKTTLLQQITSIKSTNNTNNHFRWLCIECKSSILNIWAKLFSIFDFATFSLGECCCFSSWLPFVVKILQSICFPFVRSGFVSFLFCSWWLFFLSFSLFLSQKLIAIGVPCSTLCSALALSPKTFFIIDLNYIIK